MNRAWKRRVLLGLALLPVGAGCALSRDDGELGPNEGQGGDKSASPGDVGINVVSPEVAEMADVGNKGALLLRAGQTMPNIVLIGRWMFDQEHRAPWTAWANQKMLVSLGDVNQERLVQLEIHARNQGRIPASYPTFLINVHRSDGDGNIIGPAIGVISVPASETEYHIGVGQAVVQPGAGVYLAMVWANDFHDPAHGLDANIMINQIVVEF